MISRGHFRACEFMSIALLKTPVPRVPLYTSHAVFTRNNNTPAVITRNILRTEISMQKASFFQVISDDAI